MNVFKIKYMFINPLMFIDNCFKKKKIATVPIHLALTQSPINF